MGESTNGKDIFTMNFFRAKSAYEQLSAQVKIPLGTYEVHWIGPRWFQIIAKLVIGLFGFKDWYGKQFFGKESAINIFRNSNTGNIVNKYPMLVKIAPSAIDGKDCIYVSYPKSTRFPWPGIVDEFRPWSDDALLGQSYAKFFPFFPMPFFLIRKE
jgi:hypothetical protein